MRLRPVYSSAFLAFVLLCSSGTFCSLDAQWKQMNINALGAPREGFSGSVVYKHGLVWAGFTYTAFSKDTGKTWTHFFLPNDGEQMVDIDIADSDHIVMASQDDMYLTKDGGTHWSEYPSTEDFTSVAFMGSSKMLIATSDGQGQEIWNSTNSGDNWIQQGGGPGNWAAKVIYGPSGDVLLIDGKIGRDTSWHLYSSTDLGVTWQPRGALGGEGYDLTYGGCDNQFVYVADNGGSHGNAFVDVSTDGGATFQQMNPQPAPYLCGSVAIGKDALFCQTYFDGVICSTDGGFSWKSIGGPNGAPGQTRSLAAIDNNTIIAADANGALYITYNCGGDSIASRFPVSQTPFLVQSSADTIQQEICGITTTPIRFGVDVCDTGLVTLANVTLTGSNHFTLTEEGALPRTVAPADSIQLTYSNGTNSVDTALVHLTYILLGTQHDTIISLIGRGTTSVLRLENTAVEIFGECNAFPWQARIGLEPCDTGKVILTGVSLSGSKSFTLSNVGSLPRNVGAVDTINFTYADEDFGQDTAYLNLTYTAFGDIHDTSILLVGVGSRVEPLRVQSLGTIHTIVDSGFVVPINVYVGDTSVTQDMNLQSASYSVAVDTSIIVFPADSIWEYDFTGLYSSVYAEPSLVNGQYAVQITISWPDTLVGLSTIGSFKFKAKRATSGTPITLTSLNLIGARNSIGYCVSPETNLLALVATDGAGVAESTAVPLNFACYPNPVPRNRKLNCSVDLGSGSSVSVEVYDILGHRCYEKSLGMLRAGLHTLDLPIDELPAGSYFVRLQAGNTVKTQKAQIAR